MLSSGKWLSIVGIGEDGYEGLNPASRSLVDGAEILVGGDRHLSMLEMDGRDRLIWINPITETIEQILNYRGRSVCVLASGDPMWFGIGTSLIKQISPNEVTIIPAPSTFSLICARLGWSISEVETLSLCGRPASLLKSYLYPKAKLLVLSSDLHTPKIAAQILIDTGFGDSKFTVLEHLGGSKERIVSGIAEEFERSFADYFTDCWANLNAIAIECMPNHHAKIFSRTVGLPDNAYSHDGQLTKHEVRAVTLSALAPNAGELLWDVGAGCGSIGIEWMRSHPRNKAIAIEKSRTNYIAENAACLGVPNLEIIEGIAPDVLENLPTPDAIFIGGGITSSGTVETCWQALRSHGRLVANVVTLEGEQILYKWQQKLGGTLTRVAIERAESIGIFLGWKPMMPVTQWVITKP